MENYRSIPCTLETVREMLSEMCRVVTEQVAKFREKLEYISPQMSVKLADIFTNDQDEFILAYIHPVPFRRWLNEDCKFADNNGIAMSHDGSNHHLPSNSK